MIKKIPIVTNEEVFSHLSENNTVDNLRTFCKMRKEECQFIYDNSTYAPEDILYDRDFWKQKEEELTEQMYQEFINSDNGR